MSSYLNKTLDLLAASRFKDFPIEKEKTAKDLFGKGSGYDKCRYDIVISQMSLIIEVHGEQHYRVSGFGATAEAAISQFQGTRRRDNRKEEIARENKWSYLVISYEELKTLDVPRLEERILNALQD